MRVQFSVDATEYAKLQMLAAKDGYPDVHTYCKDAALQQRDYAELWKRVKSSIAKLPKGTQFVLRDLIATPPANLGVKLYRNQSSLGISKVKEDNTGADMYEKL
jgi:hypothetical protein